MTTTNTVINVDTIDDQKGLGYPDSRKLARDSHGNLYLAYRKKSEQGGKMRYHIFVACSSDNGSTWNSNPIEQTGAYTQRMPSIAIDSQDRIHVVWYGLDLLNQNNNQHQIKYAQSQDRGQSWSSWQNIAYVPGYAGQQQWQQHPTIFVDHKDVIHVAWDGLDVDHPIAPQAKFIRSNNGGKTWSRWANVHPSPKVNRSRPTVIVAGSAIYLLAYGYVENVQQVLWSKSHDRGNYWTDWKPIAPDNRDQRHISAALDSQERLHVVWRQQPSNRESAVQAHYALYDGKTWQPPQIVSPSLTRYQFFPSITVHRSTENRENEDIPYIIWSEIDDASDYPKDAPAAGTVYYAHPIAQDEWCDPIRLRNSLNDIYPSFARNVDSGQSRLDFVWLENLGHKQKIFYDNVLLQSESKPVVDVVENALPMADIAVELTPVISDDSSAPSEITDEPVQADPTEVAPTQLEAPKTELETQPEIEAVSVDPAHIPEATIDEVESSQNDTPPTDEPEPDIVGVDIDEANIVQVDIPQTDFFQADLDERVQVDIESLLLDIDEVDSAQEDTPEVDIPEVDLDEAVLSQADMMHAEVDEAATGEADIDKVVVSQIDKSQSTEEDTTGVETSLSALEQRQIVRSETGLLYAAYAKEFQVRKMPYEQIFIAKSDDDGASWAESQKPAVQVGPYDQSTPAVAIDQENILHMVWTGFDPLNRQISQIKYSRSEDQGASWSPWRNIARVKTLPDSENKNQQAPVIACGPECTLYVAWQGTDESDAQHSQIKLIHSADQGKTWSAWQNINPEPSSCSQPNLLVTSDNIAHIIALRDTDESPQFIWTQSDDQGQSWSLWEGLDATPYKQSGLSLAVDDQNQLYAKWSQPDKAQEQSANYTAIYDQNGWQTPLLVLPEPEELLETLADDTDTIPDLDVSTPESILPDSENSPEETPPDNSDVTLDSELPDVIELDATALEQITSGDLEDIFEVATELFSNDLADEDVDDDPANDGLDGADDTEWSTEAMTAVWADIEPAFIESVEPTAPKSVSEIEAGLETKARLGPNTATSDETQDAANRPVTIEADNIAVEAIEAEMDEPEKLPEQPETTLDVAVTDTLSEIEATESPAIESKYLQKVPDVQPVAFDCETDGGSQSSLADFDLSAEIIIEEIDVEIAADETVVEIEDVEPIISPFTWPEVQSPTEHEIERSLLTATYHDLGPAFQFDRRISFWARYFDFNISPLQERSDSSSGSTLYVVKHIFTTRNGSWEPSDQAGSIPQWASATYRDPWMGQDVQDDRSHYLFGAVIGSNGNFMSQEVIQLDRPTQNGGRRSTPLGQSGWHYIPLEVDNRYRPGVTKTQWGWSPVASQTSEAVVGGTLPDDYQISIYVVWQAIPNKKIEPSPFTPLYTTSLDHHAI